MKAKEIFYLLGFRPAPRNYSYTIRRFDLQRDGPVEYAQWLHPGEKGKTISQEVVDDLRTFLRPGDVAIDIGAHTGDSTIPIALAVGKSGLVFALEPNPYVFPVLKKNSELNPEKTRIVPLMFAATPEDRDYAFEYSDSGFCNGGLHERISRWKHGLAFKLKVRGRNLASFLATEHPDLLPRIRYIKVDAEGYDLTVLTTLSGLIAQYRPFLKAEVFKHTSRAQREQLFQFLLGHGYRILRVVNEANHQGPAVELPDVMNWRHYDIFCVPQ
jgi:FkbM family methyltransferase